MHAKLISYICASRTGSQDWSLQRGWTLRWDMYQIINKKYTSSVEKNQHPVKPGQTPFSCRARLSLKI